MLKVSPKLDPAAASPLLCAGITLYSPLKHWGAGPGKKVGIVGLGGLGHMGVKFAHAFGAHTVLFTTSPSKIEDGKRLGADEVVISKNADEMAKHARSFDLIVNTVAASHDLDPFISLLKRDGTLVLVGAPEHPHPSPSVFNLLFGRRSLAGSGIGGIKETQEMLDFCAEKNIVSDIELIPVQQVNEAYDADAQGRREVPLRARHEDAVTPIRSVVDPGSGRRDGDHDGRRATDEHGLDARWTSLEVGVVLAEEERQRASSWSAAIRGRGSCHRASCAAVSPATRARVPPIMTAAALTLSATVTSGP